ncbi:MAG: OmpA family protein [Gemmatimonadota bacterium]
MHLLRRTGAIQAALVLLLAAPLSAQRQDPPPDSAWSAFDFVPGNRLLFFEDFAGTGPRAPLRRLRNATSRMAVEARGGVPSLHTRPPASFDILLPERLGERFTIDFDFFIPGANQVALSAVGPGTAGSGIVRCGPHSVDAGDAGDDARLVEIDRIENLGELEASGGHCSIAFDGPRVRIYVNQVRALDIPNGHFGRSNQLHVEFPGGDDPTLIDFNTPIWISNFRVAAGGAELSYTELVARGRIATQGILFDVGSDRIRPESSPTLLAIAALLREHPELRLTIEGHTDGVGGAAANQALSERRAQAVSAALTSRYGIAADRLVAAGFGASRPVASNDTAEGRQANRRVELVRM